jgi:hypothetical protein
MNGSVKAIVDSGCVEIGQGYYVVGLSSFTLWRLPVMIRERLLAILTLLAAFWCTSHNSAFDNVRPKEFPLQTDSGAESLEVLKVRFVQHSRNNDVKSMMAHFYLNGASKGMIDLYRRSMPKAKVITNESTILTAEILDITTDRQTEFRHTLNPVKLLLLGYGKINQDGPPSVHQHFYIGLHMGKFYLTLPTGN